MCVQYCKAIILQLKISKFNYKKICVYPLIIIVTSHPSLFPNPAFLNFLPPRL